MQEGSVEEIYRVCFTQNVSQVVRKFQKSQERKLEIIACLCKLLLGEDKTQAADNSYATVMQKLENVLAILLFIHKKSTKYIFFIPNQSFSSFLSKTFIL